MHQFEFYKRNDGKWAWRQIAANGKIMATDGGQGYENKQDCIDAFDSVCQAIMTQGTIEITANTADRRVEFLTIAPELVEVDADVED